MNIHKQLCTQLLLILALLLQASNAIGATITTQVSRNPVVIDETFDIIFEADGSPDDDPDFSPLEENFEILHRSRSQNIQLINGDYKRATRWTLAVMAKKTGNVIIPSIAFGSDRSQTITTQVQKTSQATPGSATQDIFLEILVEPENSYVQQQLIYHIQIYRAVNIEQTFETQRNGKRYLVSQISYAVFPQASGTLTLDPITFQARISQHSQRRFGSSPFDMFGQSGTMKRFHSDAVHVEIKPAPNNAGTPWLPTNNLQLSSSWPKPNPEFRVGEPVTRTLVVFADGLTSAQLPEINATIPKGFKQYPDQPALEDRQDSNGITGIRQEKTALVPTKPGLHTLPEIAITWWNTQTHQKQIARLPEMQIQVLPAEGTASEPLITTPAIATPSNEVEPQQVPEIARSPGMLKQESNLYRWLSLFLALGWLGTVITWWWLQKKQAPTAQTTDKAPNRTSKSRKQCLTILKQACQNNSPQAARTALLAWGATQWINSPPHGLTDIAMRLDSKIAEHIKLLERTLYAKNHSDWKGTDLWEAIQNIKAQQETEAGADEVLAKLYP